MAEQAQIVTSGEDSLGFFDRFVGLVSDGAKAAQQVLYTIEPEKYKEVLAANQTNANSATASESSQQLGTKKEKTGLVDLSKDQLIMIGGGIVFVIALVYIVKKI